MLDLEALAAAGGGAEVKQLRDKQTQGEEQEDDAQNDHRQQLSRDQTRDQAPVIVVNPVSLSPPEGAAADPAVATSAPLCVSLAASNAAALDQVRRTATCGICSNLVASSLVLSCGHMFCGSCLFDFLNSKPSCPTCQVSLRAIPVRCLALDGVVEALCRVLTKTELDACTARVEEGKLVANKLNKMFWWLQPAAIPALADAHNQQHQAMLPGGASAAGAAMPGAPGASAASMRARGGSCGGAVASSSSNAARHMQPRQSLDSHLACAPQQPHMTQAHLHGNQLLPGLLGCSPMGPASHLAYDTYDDVPHGQHAGFGHSLAIHQAQAQRHSQATAYGAPRPPRSQQLPQTFQALGMQQQLHGGMQGMDGAGLCNMAALGLAHPQQLHGLGQLPTAFFDYAPGPAQPGPPQQMPDYPQAVQASAQSEHLANLHAHVQLQNLLRSLSIGDWA